MIVYQFSTIDEWLSQNIFNKVVYLNTPSNFNDPTENNFSIEDIDRSRGGDRFRKDIVNSIYESLEENFEKDKMYSDKNHDGFMKSGNEKFNKEKFFEKYTDNLFDQLDGEDVYNFCHRVVKDAQMEFRIASLTKSIHNPLMWGHYADGMRGVCIEYDINDLDLNEVKYEDCYKVDILNVLAGGAAGEVKETFLRKNKNWSYEEEYRIIKVGEIFYSLEPWQLKKIYFGYKCDPNKANFVKNLAVSSFGGQVKFYIARNLVNSYYLHLEEVGSNELIEKLEEVRSSVNDHNTFRRDQELKKVFDASLEESKKE